jgi:arginine decarboxylase-like protein
VDLFTTASSDKVDIDEAVKLLRKHGVHPPVVLRFPDIVCHRLRKLQVNLQHHDCRTTSVRLCAYAAVDHHLKYTQLAAGLPVLRVAQGCFATAIRRYEFAGAFRGVFPVKCNHDRRLILNMLEAGRDSGVGLECGSKAVRFSHLVGPVCMFDPSPPGSSYTTCHHVWQAKCTV